MWAPPWFPKIGLKWCTAYALEVQQLEHSREQVHRQEQELLYDTRLLDEKVKQLEIISSLSALIGGAVLCPVGIFSSQNWLLCQSKNFVEQERVKIVCRF